MISTTRSVASITSSSQNLSTIQPCSTNQRSRASSRAISMCVSPSTSTIVGRLRLAKSAMYGPIGSCRRKRTPSCRFLRRIQSIASPLVGYRRICRAKRTRRGSPRAIHHEYRNDDREARGSRGDRPRRPPADSHSESASPHCVGGHERDPPRPVPPTGRRGDAEERQRRRRGASTTLPRKEDRVWMSGR